MTNNKVTPKQTKGLTFTIKDDNGNPVFRIRPYSSAYLCYVVDEWRSVTSRRSGETRVDWVQLECYPVTLEDACNSLLEKLNKRSDVNTSDLVEIKKTITRSANKIIKAIKEAMEGVNDG